VCKQALDQAAVLVRPHGVVSAERQNDELHEEEEHDPVDDTADDEMLAEKILFLADQAIYSGGREGNEVVDAQAEDVLADGPMTAGSTDDASGNSYRHVAAEADVRGGHVEQAGNAASYKDWKREAGLSC